MELSQINAFLAVARCGGFAAAAREQGVAPSSMTRAVAALEASLGVRLLQRTTRQVTLTEAGARYRDRVAPIAEELAAARADASDAARGPAGLLRLAASVSYGQVVIVPLLPAFAEAHPDIVVDLVLSDDRLDLVSERIDLAVRHGHLPDSQLVARRLATAAYRLVASPAYLASRGAPKTPDALAGHRALGFDFAPFKDGWRLVRGRRTAEVSLPAAFLSSNAMALRQAALGGMGVALLADWLIGEDLAAGRLAEVLPGWTAGAVGAEAAPALWLVTPTRAFVPAKVRAFEAHLTESLSRASP